MSQTSPSALEFPVYPRQTNITTNQLRSKHIIPAVVYGRGQKTLSLSLDIKSVLKYIKKEYENKIFTFKSEDKSLDGLKVLKKDISFHKLSKKPLHMDFLSLDMSQPVRVNVEINFTGKSKGVKESGGVFTIIRRDVEIECLPAEIPNSFSIDISSLDIHQNFHISDLEIPSSIKLITSLKASLCAVTDMEKEEESTTLSSSSATVADGDAPKTAAKTTDKKPDKKPETKTDTKKTKPEKKK